ncbi:MAG: BspA family leucine-rich repeat surface protein [candidate division FCPU426 bacterium]
MRQGARLAVLVFLGSLVSGMAWAATTDYFVITVKTDNAGSSASNAFTIPTTGAGYSYDVDLQGLNAWEYIGIAGNTTCVYAAPGTYTLRIRGTFPRIYFNNTGDILKILSIDQWGTGAWASMGHAFHGCANLTGQAADAPNLAAVTDLSYMFAGGSLYFGTTVNANTFDQAIGNWNTANVTTMEAMFKNAKFNQPIGTWNTAQVANMSSMFMNALAFNQDLNAWDTGSVTNMNNMFKYAVAFNGPIGSWDTSSVTTLFGMFYQAGAFNQNINAWDMSHVTTTLQMFYQAAAFNQPLGSWQTGNMTSMASMFNGARAFNQDISGWNTGQVTTMSGMFSYADAFNQDISAWDVSHVADMSDMFLSADTFNQPLAGWNTSAVTDMGNMFRSAVAFNQPIGAWNIGAVTDMSYMFMGATAFNQPLSTWDTGAVTDMNGMFFSATAFNQSLSAWDTSAVTTMAYMFQAASSFNQDLSAWNTGSVNTMTAMFANAAAFDQDLGGWDITSLLTAGSMFAGHALSLANYEALLNGWGVQNVHSNVVFDGGNSQYTSFEATTRRNALIVNKNWTITDGGVYATPTPTPTITPTIAATPAPTPRNPLEDVDLTGRLFLVYPNPGRDQIKFLVNPEHPAAVKVVLFNLGGERVSEVEDSVPAGKSAVAWDCRQVASGFYLARLFLDGREIGTAKVAVAR